MSLLYRPSRRRVSIAIMHETFDHTADLGLRIRAATLDELFAEAAEAMFEVIVEDLRSVAQTQQLDVILPADAVDYLLQIQLLAPEQIPGEQ